MVVSDVPEVRESRCVDLMFSLLAGFINRAKGSVRYACMTVLHKKHLKMGLELIKTLHDEVITRKKR